MLNEFLRDPKQRKEAKYVLRYLEDFNAKQIFYISLVNVSELALLLLTRKQFKKNEDVYFYI